MGMLLLNRIVSNQREKKRRRHARYGYITSVQQKKNPPSPEDGHSEVIPEKGSGYSGPNLPEDIWCHIHSLIPLQDAARSACVSHTFLRSWRCYPKLILNWETLGLKLDATEDSDMASCFTSRVHHILRNHSGIGVKTLKLAIPDYCNVKTCHINSWLQNAITPGIEEFTLSLPSDTEVYNFPCSLLFDGRGNSIRRLYLTDCAFRPPVGFDCFRSLTVLRLYEVRITGDELLCLISNAFALENLQLMSCNELVCLRIPMWLERLSFIKVSECKMLQVVESKAPNLSTFDFYGDPIHLSLGESSQLKYLNIEFSKPNPVNYAITELPSTVPNLETLIITSSCERVNTPMVADKFLNLMLLDIYLADDYGAFSPTFDYLSLVSFLEASPVLETFILKVNQGDMKHDSVLENALNMRQIRGQKHERLKTVEINGFCSAKSMVELTYYILENATSLENVTVDTVFNEANGGIKCSTQTRGQCKPISENMILEAHKALKAVEMYLLGRVPSTVKLNVGEPCSWCHSFVKSP